jgi:hypothetical protein
MPYAPVIYNPAAPLAAGINTAAESINNAGNGIGAMLQRLGLLHLQDSQSKAMLNAYQEMGFAKDPNLAPLFKAAKNGPLGTATAVSGVMQNYLSMQYQLRQLQAKPGIEAGRFVIPDPTGSGSGNAGSNYDLNTPPPSPNRSTPTTSRLNL